jgi:hypothetical protein
MDQAVVLTDIQASYGLHMGSIRLLLRRLSYPPSVGYLVNYIIKDSCTSYDTYKVGSLQGTKKPACLAHKIKGATANPCTPVKQLRQAPALTIKQIGLA